MPKTVLFTTKIFSSFEVIENTSKLNFDKTFNKKEIELKPGEEEKISFKDLFFDHQLSSLNTISKNHTLFIKNAFGNKNLKYKDTIYSRKPFRAWYITIDRDQWDYEEEY
jgi:hypothetical protein